MPLNADIFCNVIDNFGDIGVCWRLARQLAHEHQVDVRLWVNDLHAFKRLAPALHPEQKQQVLGDISVCHWGNDFERIQPGHIVIEGFGCTLPAAFLQAMRARRPAWLNLEYLSAEDWVEDCHGLPSVNPATGLTQYFWFPGFTPRTGGLLREHGLADERNRFLADIEAQQHFWDNTGIPDALAFKRRISLFAYENPAIAGLLDVLAVDGQTPSLLVIPEGRALSDIADWLGEPLLKAGDRRQRGALTLAIIPLLGTGNYDRLLWACTLNAVRGEDSFVRAQWAGHPLLWHIYPQEEATHLVKLDAFIAQVERHAAMPAVWAQAMRAWNQAPASPESWESLLAELPEMASASRQWADFLTSQPDLASELMHFCRRQVE